ncbi:retropepsin-like aspartic protease [uncultured Bacteroides sp.]|uniref:retropepsin-like aspartic protease n=1 Tax=uncultured Bacteroides sp. TaxID=162156 RepID=UPI002674693F|nr:retropepsin-like aspartic protease [uncultured Bacteroides sp.]
MNIKIILTLLFSVSFFAGHRVCAQTQADVQLGEILNKNDLFLLMEEYPKLKDSVSIDVLHLVAKNQLAIGFNKLEVAATAMDSLLQFHQEELGTETSLGIASIRAMNLLNLGRYAEAGKAGEGLVNSFKDVLPFESLYSFIFIERVGKSLADVPVPYLSRPDRNVVVPMKVDSVGKGHHIYIPVEVNGVVKDFIFDTGCSFGNFVTEKYAEEVGLKIVSDSIPVSGSAIGFVKLATADSLRIGEMTYHHPVFMVAPPDSRLDSVFSYSGVLGYHFIRDVQEVIIDNESGSFIFPSEISDSRPNMYLASNTPHVRIGYEGKSFDVIFDSGNVKSNLGSYFFEQFPEAVAGLEEHASQRGGFGGISEFKVVTLPEFSFTVAGSPVVLYNIDVAKSNSKTNQLMSGSLGCDFILSFKRLTVNYKNMFIQGR